jgi:hypothetical protein
MWLLAKQCSPATSGDAGHTISGRWTKRFSNEW